MTLELNEIIEALKELENVVITHYWKTIAIIDEKTDIKDFTVIKNYQNNEIILKFNKNENEYDF